MPSESASKTMTRTRPADIRSRSRAENLARAQSMEAQGRMKEARDAYTKCLDITPELAFQLIKVSQSTASDSFQLTAATIGFACGDGRICCGPLRGGCAAHVPGEDGVCRWNHHGGFRSLSVWLHAGT